MGKVDLVGLVVELIHREINDIAEFEGILVDDVEGLSQPLSDLAGKLINNSLGIADEEEGVDGKRLG